MVVRAYGRAQAGCGTSKMTALVSLRRQVGRLAAGMLGKGFWAVMDQGLFALSNFIVNILLARWLTPDAYGAFSIAFSIFLVLGTFHTALLTEPMLVFGASKYGDGFVGYLRVLLRGHWWLTAVIGGVLAGASVVLHLLGHDSMTAPLFALSIASPFILFLWLVRRACYVEGSPRDAVVAGGGYLAIVLVGLCMLMWAQAVTVVTALLLMAAASLASGLWLVSRVARTPYSGQEVSPGAVLANHWRYSKWAVAAALLTWLPGNVYVFLLPILRDLEGVAAYRAVLNLQVPIMNVAIALGTVVLPAMARKRHDAGFDRFTVRAILIFLVPPLVYWGVLAAVPSQLFTLFYGSQYADHAHLLRIAGAIPVVASIAVAAGAAVRALELTRIVFVAYLASSLVAVTAGMGLIASYGIEGALLASLAAYATTACVLVIFLRLGNKADGVRSS